jgi:lipopolysaccharide export system protein LptA
LKLFVFIIFYSCIVKCFSQISGPSQKIKLLHADSLIGKAITGEEIFSGNVSVIQGVVKIQSDVIKLFSKENRATFNGNVKIEQPGLVITAGNGDYDGSTRLATGTDGISLTEDNAIITAQTGVYNTYNKRAKFLNDVIVKQGNTIVKAPQADYSSIDKKVEFKGRVNYSEGTTNLSANNATYYTITKKSFFSGNVVLIDKELSLTSDFGEIDNLTNKAVFRGNLKVSNNNMNVISEQVEFDNVTKKANFKGKVIMNDKGTITYADEINYDINTGRALLNGIVSVENDSIKINANKIDFNKKTGESIITGNGVLYLKKENTLITGDTMINKSKEGYSKAFGNPKIVFVETIKNESSTGKQNGDTTIITADTIESFKNDTNQNYIGNGNFKIVKGSMKAVADIGKYFVKESVIILSKNTVKLIDKPITGELIDTNFLNKDSSISQKIINSDCSNTRPSIPVIWYENSQISADSISIGLANKKINSINAIGKGLTVMKNKLENRFDQIYADSLFFIIKSDTIRKVNCIKYASSIYYLYDNENPNGVEQVSGDKIEIYFKEGKPNKIKVNATSEISTKGEYFPEGLVKNNELKFKLENFRYFVK